MSGRLYVGTSGFNFPDWIGPFYPPGTKPAAMLNVYADRLPSVEVNYTFRRDVSEKTIERWRDATPDKFQFALKAHQRITHFRRLGEGAGEAVESFLRSVSPLGAKLGVVLFQCPPNLVCDRDTLERFLELLPKGGRFAFEFRHASWDAARDLVVGAGHAWCISDTDDAPATDQSPGDAPFAYLRLRRATYADALLEQWGERIRSWMARGTDVFAYVKHEEGAAGALFAQRLAELAEPART
jgi:uncharacterized protein YecE (DUF72 family)